MASLRRAVDGEELTRGPCPAPGGALRLPWEPSGHSSGCSRSGCASASARTLTGPARRAHSRGGWHGDPGRQPRLSSAAWHSGGALGALRAWGGRQEAGWLALAAPGGGRPGNVACASGNAPIALAPRPARSVWSLLALMQTDSVARTAKRRGRSSHGLRGGGSRTPGDSRGTWLRTLSVSLRQEWRTGLPTHLALTSEQRKRAKDSQNWF